MILRAMLQRLYASLIGGPGLNARPHFSRQRLDLLELRHLTGTDPAQLITRLLDGRGGPVEFPACVPVFERPEQPEDRWTEAQRTAGARWDRQARLLQKIREIAADAGDYYNDHGEHALHVGFPLLSLPPNANPDRQSIRTPRILAPLALIPVQLQVRRGAGSGLTLEAAADGADLLQPNPALLAWLEQQTGTGTEALFADDNGEDPWGELAGLVALVAKALQFNPGPGFIADTELQPVPRTDELPAGPALLPCAVLGLFPIVNPGLLRDTKWMLEQEANLPSPTRRFLAPETLAAPAPAPVPPPIVSDGPAPDSSRAGVDEAPATGGRSSATSGPGPADALLVTPADPCQAAAVAHARHQDALVVHGPPGTGKSQTIANIIGDHLARGERVLFVCDKRTALDVVKYRLDALALGPLCGVIHDPQRDRRDFYVGLRDRLEALAAEPVLPDPALDLELVQQRIDTLRRELRHAFDQLHGTGQTGRSFHQLCGEWLALSQPGRAEIPDIDGFTLNDLERHRADAEELLGRARRARWKENPFRNRLGARVQDWLAADPAGIQARLEAAAAAAARLDELARTEPGAAPLDSPLPPAELASARARLAERLEAVARRTPSPAWGTLARDPGWRRWQEESTALAAEGVRVDTPLDRELVLTLDGQLPGPAEIARHLLALDAWEPIAGSWTRHFALARKRAAAAALSPLGLPLTPAPDTSAAHPAHGSSPIQRARTFYLGLKARLLWSDLRQRLSPTDDASASGPGRSPLVPDGELLALRDGLADLFALLGECAAPGNEGLQPLLAEALPVSKPVSAATSAALVALADRVRRSAARARAIVAILEPLGATGLFTTTAMDHLGRAWGQGEAAAPLCRSFVAFAGTLEDALRLGEGLIALPAPLRQALELAADRGLDWEGAESALRALGLSRAIRARLREDESLARLDSERVEAAFAELSERAAARLQLVRQRILHGWQQRWRTRLLAGTGSRLNALGAGLRQRLFVRGQKAMKLRPMIAAGAGTEGGDPLFDLCPVWMASPATVAQIFPRDALFDVVVFDEASQCRLEEALPVLLRGRRVVIAGDPRQLPPTRFFEQALAESDAAQPETAEEVFQQQQSEAEDLLSAALNLNVQEAFLDVHYRSRHEALIGYSNAAFYGGRLQPVPAHPTASAGDVSPTMTPLRLVRVDGTYAERGNVAEAEAAARIVAELLALPTPPSIGIACFNLPQRDRILEALEALAAADAGFATKLEEARQRRGRDTFEGLFVKNLENVQGDERDHLILSTTFGPDAQGRFRRNFGALSRAGGERRLNVLVTRAREAVHILTSIPREEYAAAPAGGSAKAPAGDAAGEGQGAQGRLHLYGYLRYAERLGTTPAAIASQRPATDGSSPARCTRGPTSTPSPLAEAVADRLLAGHGIGSQVYWGNEGFQVDVALAHPERAGEITLGILTDFTRFAKTPDPIAWEQFRSAMLTAQGWTLHRLWSPILFRAAETALARARDQHHAHASAPAAGVSAAGGRAQPSAGRPARR